jgi:hypothetical protein
MPTKFNEATGTANKNDEKDAIEDAKAEPKFQVLKYTMLVLFLVCGTVLGTSRVTQELYHYDVPWGFNVIGWVSFIMFILLLYIYMLEVKGKAKDGLINHQLVHLTMDLPPEWERVYDKNGTKESQMRPILVMQKNWIRIKGDEVHYLGNVTAMMHDIEEPGVNIKTKLENGYAEYTKSFRVKKSGKIITVDAAKPFPAEVEPPEGELYYDYSVPIVDPILIRRKSDGLIYIIKAFVWTLPVPYAEAIGHEEMTVFRDGINPRLANVDRVELMFGQFINDKRTGDEKSGILVTDVLSCHFIRENALIAWRSVDTTTKTMESLIKLYYREMQQNSDQNRKLVEANGRITDLIKQMEADVISRRCGEKVLDKTRNKSVEIQNAPKDKETQQTFWRFLWIALIAGIFIGIVAGILIGKGL